MNELQFNNDPVLPSDDENPAATQAGFPFTPLQEPIPAPAQFQADYQPVFDSAYAQPMPVPAFDQAIPMPEFAQPMVDPAYAQPQAQPVFAQQMPMPDFAPQDPLAFLEYESVEIHSFSFLKQFFNLPSFLKFVCFFLSGMEF